MKKQTLQHLAHVCMGLSIVFMICALTWLSFGYHLDKAKYNDVVLVCLILGSCFSFFIGGYIQEYSHGVQQVRFLESQRQSAMRSAVYGICSSSLGFVVLMLALVYGN